jgi:hypothetical protein
VVDNSTDQTTLYYNQGPDGAATGGGVTGAFRNGTTAALSSFYARNNDGSAAWIDDSYIDTTGSNLTNPVIPEPSSLLLSALGLTWILALRRRA